MTQRPRASSVSANLAASSPFIEARSSSSGLFSSNPLIHLPVFPLSSVIIKINNLLVNDNANFFVSLKLHHQNDFIDPKSLKRTEVSSSTKKSIQYTNNTFVFDTNGLTATKQNQQEVNSNPAPLLGSIPRTSSSTPNLNLNHDILGNLKVFAKVFKVEPKTLESAGSTNLVASGFLPLSPLYRPEQSHSPQEAENETNGTSNSTEGTQFRLTRQESNLSQKTEESVDNEGFINTTLLLRSVTDNITYIHSQRDNTSGSTANSDSNTENVFETEFGQIGLLVRFVRKNLKDSRRLKKKSNGSTGDFPKESTTGVLVGPGLFKYINPHEPQSNSYSLRCYGVTNLPKPVRTFLTVKTTNDVLAGVRAKANTPTTPPACNYSWTDALVVNINTHGSHHESKKGLLLSLVDYLKKTFIAKCIIPIDFILPGEQYNFAIMLNNQGSLVYISLSLEPNLSFQTNLFGKHPDLCSLEVFLHGVQRIRPPHPHHLDPFSSSSYLAVIHLENDLKKYLKSIQNEKPKLPFQTIKLEDPTCFSKLIPSAYKISPPSQASLYPQWNSLFELNQTMDELFEANAVLIVELFEMNLPRIGSGSIDFFGWAAIPLSEMAKPGIRDGFIVRQNTILHLDASHLEASIESCDFTSDTCAPHEFSIILEMRRWSSRHYVGHKQKHLVHDAIDVQQRYETSQQHIILSKHPQPSPRREAIINSLKSKDQYQDGYMYQEDMDSAGDINGTEDSQSNLHEFYYQQSNQQVLSNTYPYSQSSQLYELDGNYSQDVNQIEASMNEFLPPLDPIYETGEIDSEDQFNGKSGSFTRSTSLAEMSQTNSSHSDHDTVEALPNVSSSLGTTEWGSDDSEPQDSKTISDPSYIGYPVSQNTIPINFSSSSNPSLPVAPNSPKKALKVVIPPSYSVSQNNPPTPIIIPSPRDFGINGVGGMPGVLPSPQYLSSPGLRPHSFGSAFGHNIGPNGEYSQLGLANGWKGAQSPTTNPPSPTFPTDYQANGLHSSSDSPFSPSKSRKSLTSNTSIRMPSMIDRREPKFDPNTPEAEKNRRILELRVAELDLDSTSDCPEKRILSSIFPQVRKLVTKAASTLAKATLAQQRASMLAAENAALKQQIQKLLASRQAENSPPIPSLKSSRSPKHHKKQSSDAGSESTAGTSNLETPTTKDEATTSCTCQHSSHSELYPQVEELKALLNATQESNFDQVKSSEEAAKRVAEDLFSGFAYMIEKYKSEMTKSPLASPSSEDSELRHELNKLREAYEQLQRKYTLTSAAFGEEVMILRSKLRERKHQLQESRKYPTAPVVQIPQQRHYVALSPLHPPPHPQWSSAQPPDFLNARASSMPSPVVAPASPTFKEESEIAHRIRKLKNESQETPKRNGPS